MIVQTSSSSLPPPVLLNSGGPSSRTRKAHVRATLLGRDRGHIRCPRVHRLALWFDLLDPLEVMSGLMSREGFSSAEEIRGEFAIPGSRLLATPLPEHAQRLDARYEDPRKVLEQALMLGLCTQHMYDPERPVLWTRASLRRGLELFDPAGFYA